MFSSVDTDFSTADETKKAKKLRWLPDMRIKTFDDLSSFCHGLLPTKKKRKIVAGVLIVVIVVPRNAVSVRRPTSFFLTG